MAAAAAILMREDHGMSEDTAAWQSFTEQEWLDTWQAIYGQLKLTEAALAESLSEVQAARIDGELAMLRRVLESRGVDLVG